MKLWNIGNWVINPENINACRYQASENPSTPALLQIFMVGDPEPLTFAGGDAEYLYRIIRSQSISVETRGRESAMPFER
jgi:hypothetical protein